MDDLISRQAAIDALKNRWKKTRNYEGIGDDIAEECELYLKQVPSAQPTLRERALMLLLNWAVECDFGYDNFPEEYERYKDEIEDMSYLDGMIYIAEKEVERNARRKHDLHGAVLSE